MARMMRLYSILMIISLLLASLLLQACTAPVNVSTPPAQTAVSEIPVQLIPLSGPASEARAEISGMAWLGDTLVLLPQYPTRISPEGEGALLALPRSQIEDFLDGRTAGPLQPALLPLSAPGLEDKIPGFEGFEAIAFSGDRVYLTIESRSGLTYQGVLVSGRVQDDPLQIVLEPENLQVIEAQTRAINRSDEALLVAGDRLLTFYETNGREVNPSPLAHAFSLDLEPQQPIPFPHVEYRITDVSTADADGVFWAINYFYPGDRDLRSPHEPIAERYGAGPTHAREEGVERLLAFQLTAGEIILLDRPPLLLELQKGASRNWEGLVRLDGRGFLLVTDEHPTTLFGFIPHAEAAP